VRLSSDGTNLSFGQRRQFTVSVTDFAGTNWNRTYDVRVIGPGPTILTSQLTLKAGQLVDIALAATNDSAPFSWSILSGALPDGISLSPGGSVQGTPSPDAAEVGETGLYTNVIERPPWDSRVLLAGHRRSLFFRFNRERFCLLHCRLPPIAKCVLPQLFP
jgi:hypothetical protein